MVVRWGGDGLSQTRPIPRSPDGGNNVRSRDVAVGLSWLVVVVMTRKGRVYLVVVEVVWPSLLAVGGHVVIHNKYIRYI